MEAGHQGKTINRKRFIPVHTIAQKLGKTVCQCLPAVHALTGCDTTSGLHKVGKRTAYTKLVQYANQLPALGTFGTVSEFEDVFGVAR